MPKFRKRPVVIDAEQWRIDQPLGSGEGLHRAVCGCPDLGTWHIHTLEGPHDLTDRDWIVRGIQGEHYPVKDDIFRATYEPAEGE